MFCRYISFHSNLILCLFYIDIAFTGNVAFFVSGLTCVFPVAGGWCEWSEWTPCSRTCGAESVSRYRSCSCPEPKAGGAACSGKQEVHSGVGVQIERQLCPVITFCPGATASGPPKLLLSQISLSSCNKTATFVVVPPVHGSWSPWSAWSDCDACAGSSTRTRECNSPPRRFGGLPCLGESRQRRSCHDNTTICSGKHNKVLFAS